MKLRDFRQINESAENTYTFVTQAWNGNDTDDLKIEPFDVEVTYFAHEDEKHGHIVQVTALKATQPVKVSSEKSLDLERLPEVNMDAVVLSQDRTGALQRLQSLFPNSATLNMSKIPAGNRGAFDVYHFLEENKDETVILELGGSTILAKDHEIMAMVKAALDGGRIFWKSVHHDSEFNFTGRVIIHSTVDGTDFHAAAFMGDLIHGDGESSLAAAASNAAGDSQSKDLERKVHRAIHNRAIVVDITSDRTFPRGTRVQDIPGWQQEFMKHFEELAEKDYKGH